MSGHERRGISVGGGWAGVRELPVDRGDLAEVTL